MPRFSQLGQHMAAIESRRVSEELEELVHPDGHVVLACLDTYDCPKTEGIQC